MQGITLAEFACIPRDDLVSEFERELGPERVDDRPCEAFRRNAKKNRYERVLCLDASRVRLKGGGSDYVHANWVDGYQQSNAYICAQGPLPSTVPDFLAMIWQCDVSIIAMTTRLVHGNKPLCAPYWPQVTGETQFYGHFSVTSESVEHEGSLTVTNLTISYCDLHRSLKHLHFTSWPDFGIPQVAGEFLNFLNRVRKAASERGGPVLVHCSAGIGRTGTFVTLDICLRRLADTGKVDLLGTVRKLRDQRAGAVETAEQYVFCHTAMLEYAAIHDHGSDKK